MLYLSAQMELEKYLDINMRTGLYKSQISVKSMGFCTIPLAKVAKVLGCVYRAQKSKEENHTLARKKNPNKKY